MTEEKRLQQWLKELREVKKGFDEAFVMGLLEKPYNEICRIIKEMDEYVSK